MKRRRFSKEQILGSSQGGGRRDADQGAAYELMRAIALDMASQRFVRTVKSSTH
jgi:hypothetical protein